ncbi:hypothetical protein [Parabacteroides sp. Marseille-P3160]|uniref:hypothetical protein n=1 Tax=Parabacteroides sp. Marseille-P3160 TaxID=1917887 RepID=UPI001118D34D|nr:hypothetical protein [Parabacteroides sp. Marseille-P3160]
MAKFMLSLFLLYLFTQANSQISAYSEDNPLLGTWKYVKTKVDIKTSDPTATGIIKDDIVNAPMGTLTFRQDGTGTSLAEVKEMNDSFEFEFTYDLTGDSLIIYTEIVPGEDDFDGYNYMISGKTLTLVSDNTSEYDADTLEDIDVPNPDQVKIEKVISTFIYTRP